jgi:hypothetical protein
MKLKAHLDTFAREQQVGLGALARLSRPGDEDLPEPAAWDLPWDPEAVRRLGSAAGTALDGPGAYQADVQCRPVRHAKHIYWYA